jgi:two-component system nitrogen regulation response regulator GlnG
MSSVLVIDDDRSVQHLVAYAFEESEIEVLVAGTAAEGLEALRCRHPDVVLLDIMLPEVSGLDLFQQIHAFDPRVPVIFVTILDSSDTTIKAMQLGAFDYLIKPLSVARVRELVGQAVEIHRLMSVPVALPGAGKLEPQADLLVGRSRAMQEVYKAIGRVASQNVTVLVRGESGTGKELVARAIYQHSQQSDKPFLAVNCAAIPDALLESELFGHEKGSFTGAVQRRIGKFEQCSEGTLFLDEVGDMSPVVQSKVLRVLQGQEFERVGGSESIRTNVRIIAATNRDLERMVADGKFRADLYYRLSGFTIFLPPLRERPDDLLLLLETFLTRFSQEMHKDVQGISPDCMDGLLQYPWPGNVRELENVLKQALLQASGPVLVSEFLPAPLRAYVNRKAAQAAGDGLPDADWPAFIEQQLAARSTNLYDEVREVVERYLVARVLRETNGNQSQAARILGITRGNLRNKIRTLELRLDHSVEVQNEHSEPVEPIST